jgi:hypothetical protein
VRPAFYLCPSPTETCLIKLRDQALLGEALDLIVSKAGFRLNGVKNDVVLCDGEGGEEVLTGCLADTKLEGKVEVKTIEAVSPEATPVDAAIPTHDAALLLGNPPLPVNAK